MKKVLMTMVLAACACTAMADRKILSWFTLGPDKYADGTCVLEGEYYALVWVKEGTEFRGFNADATLVDAENSEILAIGPWATKWTAFGVGCKPHNIQPDDEEAAKYVNGSLRLYVLDTRTPQGTLPVTVAKDGVEVPPRAVNGYGEASKAKFQLQNVQIGAPAGQQAQAGVATEVPPNAAKPKITGIRIENGYAYLTVSGTEPYLQYNVAAGKTPGKLDNGAAAAAPKVGEAGKEIELKVPVDGKNQFFKINRNPLVK